MDKKTKGAHMMPGGKMMHGASHPKGSKKGGKGKGCK